MVSWWTAWATAQSSQDVSAIRNFSQAGHLAGKRKNCVRSQSCASSGTVRYVTLQQPYLTVLHLQLHRKTCEIVDRRIQYTSRVIFSSGRRLRDEHKHRNFFKTRFCNRRRIRNWWIGSLQIRCCAIGTTSAPFPARRPRDTFGALVGPRVMWTDARH